MDQYNNDYRGGYDSWDAPYLPEPAAERPRTAKRKRRGGSGVKAVLLCLLCAVVFAGVRPLYDHFSGANNTVLYTGDRPAQVVRTAVNTEEEMSPAEVYDAFAGSTVGITVDIVSTNIFGQTVTGAAAGTGFVITEDGYIVTNYHVIENANSIKVTFLDGETYPATFVGGEEANDIAVIKIEAEDLTPVIIGSSEDMRVGETVIAIGNPLGELTFSETTGIISAMDRSITMSDGRRMNMLQTDCAINSGNSGGPLFNDHGEVIGIVSAKYSSGSYSNAASVEGLGFAIPIDDVATMIKDLIEKGYVSGKPYLGLVMSQSGVSAEAQAYGVPAGVLILGVTDGLAAQEAGLQAGDIITKVDGTETATNSDLTAAIRAKAPGDEITITVYREGELLDLTATLVEATAENEEATQALTEQIVEEQRQQMQEQQQQQQQQGGMYGWPFGSLPW